MSDFRVSGYDVIEMIGFGGSADVWLGRDSATGELVALKRLRHPRDAETVERLRREAAALGALSHPHVIRLRGVVDAGDEVVLVLDYAAGGSLASLLGTRGRLSPGEVVTLAVPLAEALNGLSAHGLVHGDISPANILFSRDGRPLLGDFGVVQIMGTTRTHHEATADFLDPEVLRGGVPTPASDVYSLGAVCLAALRGSDFGRGSAEKSMDPALPPHVLAVLLRATSPDPIDRPTAAALASELFDACAAAPIRPGDGGKDASLTSSLLTSRVVPRAALSEVAENIAPRRWRRAKQRLTAERIAGGRQRPAIGLISLVMVIVIAGSVGMLWARSQLAGSAATLHGRRATESVGSSPSTRPSATTPSNRAESWAATLRRLDVARSRAFAAADAAALERVYAPRAPALRRDRRLLARLVEAGSTARGLHLEIESVRPVRVAHDRVLLEVVDVMSAFEVLSHDGQEVDRHQGRPSATWLVTLARGDGEWRVFEVARA